MMSTGPAELHALCILVVDDEPAAVKLLHRIVQAEGYACVRTATNAHDAIAEATVHPPDIMLLDLHMSGVSGLGVLDQLRNLNPFDYPMVIVITGDDSREAKAQVLSAGARDFIAKPFDMTEVVLRINNLAELRVIQKTLQSSNVRLEEEVRERTADLVHSRIEVLDRLAMAGEFRDDDTGRHTRRVGTLALRLAQGLDMSGHDAEMIAVGAPLHDVGKIGIPDDILLKPGPLDADEMRIMQSHTTIGATLMDGGQSPLLAMAREIALAHHERWDGTGYPQHLAGEQIPRCGRIVALADVFDALSHDRPYRPRYAFPDVMAMIREQRGQHFDPAVVDSFLERADAIRAEVIAPA